MGEISRGGDISIEDDSLGWSKELTLVELYLEVAHRGECCGDL